MLSAGSDDLNVRSTFVHMAGDALSAVSVIIAGIGILLTGWQFLDPIVSVLIGLFILWSSWSIVREAVNILMEGTPAGLNMGELIADMNSVQGVNTVHDVHVWTIGHDRLALSAHVNTVTAPSWPLPSVLPGSMRCWRPNTTLCTRHCKRSARSAIQTMNIAALAQMVQTVHRPTIMNMTTTTNMPTSARRAADEELPSGRWASGDGDGRFALTPIKRAVEAVEWYSLGFLLLWQAARRSMTTTPQGTG